MANSVSVINQSNLRGRGGAWTPPRCSIRRRHDAPRAKPELGPAAWLFGNNKNPGYWACFCPASVNTARARSSAGNRPFRRPTAKSRIPSNFLGDCRFLGPANTAPSPSSSQPDIGTHNQSNTPKSCDSKPARPTRTPGAPENAVENRPRRLLPGPGCPAAPNRRPDFPTARAPGLATPEAELPREGPRSYVRHRRPYTHTLHFAPGTPSLINILTATDYSRPRNVGTLDKSDQSVGEGLVGAPAVRYPRSSSLGNRTNADFLTPTVRRCDAPPHQGRPCDAGH